MGRLQTLSFTRCSLIIFQSARSNLRFHRHKPASPATTGLASPAATRQRVWGLCACLRELPEEHLPTCLLVRPSSPSATVSVAAVLLIYAPGTIPLPVYVWKHLPLHGLLFLVPLCDSLLTRVLDVNGVEFLNLVFYTQPVLRLGEGSLPTTLRS